MYNTPAIRLPMVPDVTNNADSIPNNLATLSCSAVNTHVNRLHIVMNIKTSPCWYL